MTQLHCAAWYMRAGNLRVAVAILRAHPAVFAMCLPQLRAAWLVGAVVAGGR